MIRITSRRPGPAPKPAPAAQVGASAPKTVDTWRQSENQTLQSASRIAGISCSSLYRAQAEGRLRFKRLCGRVVVTTESLAALVDAAEDWQPSSRGKEARAARRALEAGGAAA